MSHRKNIEIYKNIEKFNTPLAENSNMVANCGVGDTVIIIDNVVWIRNWNDNIDGENEFVQAVYLPEFVRINDKIFEKER